MTDLSQGQAAEAPQDISLKLAVPPTLSVSVLESNTLLRDAQEFIIDCKEMADLAASRRKGCKAFYEGIDAMRKDFLEPAALLVEKAKKWFNPPIGGAQQAERIYTEKLIEWDKSERERVAEENRKREEVARKLRQEADAKAAQERAKAAEIARQREAEAKAAALARAQAEASARAAAAARARAIEEGNKEAARKAAEDERKAREEAQQKAAAEARANEQSAAAIENGEANARAAELHAAAVATAPAATVEKVAGFVSRKHFVVEFAPNTTEVMAKELIVEAIVKNGRRDLLSIISIDMKSANKLAQALELNLNVPGLVARNRPIGASNRN